MSMIPGYELEDFLSDAYRIFDKSGEYGSGWARSNYDASSGKVYGDYKIIDDDDFKKFVTFFESLRERIEYLLDEFDEENMSWRDYKYFTVSDAIPDEVEEPALKFLKELKGNK